MSRFFSCFGKSRHLTKKKNSTQDTRSHDDIAASTTDLCPENQYGSSQPTGQASSHPGSSVHKRSSPLSTQNSGSQSNNTGNTNTLDHDNRNRQQQLTETDTHHPGVKEIGSTESTLDSCSHFGITARSTTNPAQENHSVENNATGRISSHSGIQETGTPGSSGDVPIAVYPVQGNSSPANFSMDSSMYPTKGKGLCIIMANFIPQKLRDHEPHTVLPGYKKDIELLVELFQSQMFDFDVKTELNGLGFRNLSSQQFRTSLRNIQQLFVDREKEGQPRYDKFLLFVLSHGGEGGIYMCQEGSDGREEEIVSNDVCMIAQEEIINSFTHDRVPLLKGIPKCFFFQACRGSGLTHAAAKAGNLISNDEEECRYNRKSDEKERLSLPSVTRKNILVACASLDTKKSYVHSEMGSWFIQDLTSVLRKQCEHKDIFEILTEMIALTSTKPKHERFICNSKNCVIKVNWEKQLCPVMVVGKVSHGPLKGMGQHHTYRPVFVSHRNTYTGFAQAEDFSLHSYKFKGTVSFQKYKGHQVEFKEWVSAEHLNAFENEKHFEIDGRLKNQYLETKLGILKIDGDKWEGEPIPQEGKMEEVEVVIKYKEELIPISDPTQFGEAFVYISDRLYGSGPFKEVNGVWGVEVEMYQLPVFTSTLTKQLYLAKLNKKKDASEIINREVTAKVKETLAKFYELKLSAIIPKLVAENPDSNVDVFDVDKSLSANLPECK